ncbi:MAG: hypothetical protein WCO44_03345 [Bacteroidota bacterium]
MTTIEFKGPFLFKDLVNEKDAYKPGIYIWGFKYPDDNKFIPYYVGKSLSNIVGRIAQHKGDILKAGSTYMRLSANYMKSFYMDDSFHKLRDPRKYDDKPPEWFDHFQEKVDYINARWFIKMKNKKDPGKELQRQEYPISMLKSGKDFLNDNIEKMYICYAVVPEPDLPDLRKFETMTFFSLKGRTRSKTDKFPGKNPEIQITDSTKDKQIFKEIRPGDDFPGY